MGLGHPHCYARRRTDGYGIFPCYPDGEPPYVRRKDDDGSDADVEIDLSDDDPDDWIERWFPLPVVSSYAAPEERRKALRKLSLSVSCCGERAQKTATGRRTGVRIHPRSRRKR